MKWPTKVLLLKAIVLGCILIVRVSYALGFEIEGIPIDLQAQHFRYDNDTQDIHATGNVILNYKNTTVFAQQLDYMPALHLLQLKHRISFHHQGSVINADSMVYNFKSQSGNIDNVSTTFNNVVIAIDNASISPQTVTFHNSLFTTCSLQNPHYSVHAQSVILSPENGDVMSTNNWLYLYGVPGFFIPSYVHHTRAVAQNKGLSSMPEIGYSTVDGSYGAYYAPYFLSPHSTGGFTFKWTSYRGSIYGFNHRLSINSKTRVLLKALNVQYTGFEGGLVFQWDLLRMEQPQSSVGFLDTFLNYFSSDLNLTRAHLSLFYLYNDIIQYQLVDFLPAAQLEFKNIHLPYNILLSTSMFGGAIREGTADTDKFEFAYDTQKNISLSSDSSLDLKGHHGYSRYGTGDSWHRLYYTLKYTYSPFLNTEVSYTDSIINDGRSPFKFDSINKVQSDELGVRLTTTLLNATFIPEFHYSLETHSFRDIMLTLQLNQHCWLLNISWNMVWHELRLGASLR